jgi:hypothetical protein
MGEHQRVFPEPSDLDRPNPVRPLYRAAVAAMRAAITMKQRTPTEVVEQTWPKDAAAIAITKAATTPASITGWGGAATAKTIVADFVSDLVPLSGAAELMRRTPNIDLTGIREATIPGRSGLPSGSAAWAAEGDPAPVKQFTVTSNTLGPVKKLLLGAALTRELANAGNAEDVVRQLLREDGAASLDATLFDANPATAARPAGLRNGVSALAATAGGGENAMFGDRENLGGAVLENGGSQVLYFAHPQQWLSARLRLGRDRAVDIFPTLGLPVGSILAIEPSAFVSAFGPEPQIEASIEALIHFEDVPLPIGTPPNTVAAPTKSAFQSDLIVLRMRLTSAIDLFTKPSMSSSFSIALMPPFDGRRFAWCAAPLGATARCDTPRPQRD